MNVAITVTGKDRPGIIAALSGAIFTAGGNLEDASMTILEGEFAMIVLAQVKSTSAFAKLKTKLGKIGCDFHVFVQQREIKRKEEDEYSEIDMERYQTIFSTRKGAVASPTAGLHFTEDLVDKLKHAGISIAALTLHIGYGTFRPVRTKDIRKSG